MKRKCLIPLLLSGILLISAGRMVSGATQQTALDAFNSLMNETDSVPEAEAAATESYTYLDAIMAGEYSALPEDQEGLETMAASLSLLTSITSRDLASYASSKGYAPAQVRNAYYKALANAIRAELLINPDAGGQESNLAILSLFIREETDTSAETEKAEIREEMTPEYSEEIALESGLPQDFVEFVIMSGNWEDENWENDDDWKQGTAWAEEDGFVDITIGMRDNPGEDRIAKLQEALISLGYLKGKADGVFGVRTQSALLEFQMANALPANGICTAEVMKKLAAADVVSRRDYVNAFWDTESGQARGTAAAGYDTPDDDDGEYDTPDDNTPDNDYDTPDNERDYNTPDDNTPDDDDYNTPDYNTPDHDTPDNDGADYDTPDYDTPNDD